MPRKPRFIIPGQPLHIILRGNNREPIFYAEADYQYYLDRLKESSRKHSCAIHAYVLMTNHVHLLITPESVESPGRFMQMIGRYYVQYFNTTYKRSGTLFEGRYRSSLIDSDAYLLLCQRYIELNPVSANMVSHPADYPWSSYAANALGNVLRQLITPHEVYLALGEDMVERQEVYEDLFESEIGRTTAREIVEATNKGWVLGTEQYKQQIAAKLQRPVSPSARGGDHKSMAYRESRKT